MQESTGGDARERVAHLEVKSSAPVRRQRIVPEEARKRCRRRVYSAQVVGTQPAPLPM